MQMPERPPGHHCPMPVTPPLPREGLGRSRQEPGQPVCCGQWTWSACLLSMASLEARSRVTYSPSSANPTTHSRGP